MHGTKNIKFIYYLILIAFWQQWLRECASVLSWYVRSQSCSWSYLVIRIEKCFEPVSWCCSLRCRKDVHPSAVLPPQILWQKGLKVATEQAYNLVHTFGVEVWRHVTFIYSRITDGIRMVVSTVFKATSYSARALPCSACRPASRIFISPGDRV